MMLNFCVICASVPCYCHISRSYFVGFHVVHLFRKTVNTVLSFHVAMQRSTEVIRMAYRWVVSGEAKQHASNMSRICQHYMSTVWKHMNTMWQTMMSCSTHFLFLFHKLFDVLEPGTQAQRWQQGPGQPSLLATGLGCGSSKLILRYMRYSRK